jgi:hypothetical protein
MNRDDIIRWAREAGFNIEQGFLLRVTGIDEDLARFAELVAAAEREACAKMFDGDVWAYDYREIAAAIRARNEKV